MIISLTMGIVLAVVIGLGLIALFYFLMRKKAQKAGVIIGIILGLIAGVAFIMMAGRITVVQGQEDCGTYLVYGSPTYEFSDGTPLKLDMGSNEGYIINDSEMELVLEKVIYTTSYYSDSYYDILVKPMSVTPMPGFKVNYYFDDIPPDEIEVSESSGDVSKYWLRTRSSYESDYGFSYYDESYESVQVGSGTASEPEGDTEGDED